MCAPIERENALAPGRESVQILPAKETLRFQETQSRVYHQATFRNGTTLGKKALVLDARSHMGPRAYLRFDAITWDP